MTALGLTERAVRAARLYGMGLAGPGLADVDAVLRENLFVQAQIETPALQGLSMRLTGRPTQAQTRALLLERRALARSWGPRDTLHLFSLRDWPTVVAARPAWVRTSRVERHALRPAMLEAARARVAGRNHTFTRSDLRDLLPPDWLDTFSDPDVDTIDKKWRFGTGRLIWHLSNEGRCCHAHREGSEQAYAPQHLWLAGVDVAAAAAQLDTVTEAAAMGRRYLQTYGPATVQDMAHFFGARIRDAHTWIARMPDLIEIRCGGRVLLACAEAEAALRAAEALPLGVRLLPGYDNLLMGHADKHWTVPVEAERKVVWRKAAVVAAVVLSEGVAVGTWEYAVRARRVEITVTPLSGWRGSALTSAVQAEADALAVHLGQPAAALQICAG